MTLQDVFANMGALGPVFGVLFYLLVIIAAISSAISLMEVVGAFAIDNAAKKGKQVDRTKVTLIVSGLILIEALLVAVDGLGSTGIFRWKASAMWNDCMLDFMDCWSEGVAMPVGAMLMSLMIGLELKPKFILDEIGSVGGFFRKFYSFCITIVCPLVMAADRTHPAYRGHPVPRRDTQRQLGVYLYHVAAGHCDVAVHL